MRHQVEVEVITRMKYPWSEMSIGDDFIVPSDGDPKRLRARICSCANGYRRRHGCRFKTRVITNSPVFILVTRIA